MTRIVAHRGWSGKAPENTMAAFSLALTHPEIEAIELDVHLSKDGIPVVIHDYTIDRTTDGSGAVVDYTAEELRQFDAGQWFDDAFTGEYIPTLQEVFSHIGGKKKLLVELKQKANYYPGLEQKVVQLIQEHQLQEQVRVISFDHTSLEKVKEADPYIETGLIYLGMVTLLKEQLAHTGAKYIGMHHEFMTDKVIEIAGSLGVEVGAWTVDEEAAVNRIKAFTGDLLITTNHPDRLMEETVSLLQ